MKLPYTAPKLKTYGSVEKITLGNQAYRQDTFIGAATDTDGKVGPVCGTPPSFGSNPRFGNSLCS